MAVSVTNIPGITYNLPSDINSGSPIQESQSSFAAELQQVQVALQQLEAKDPAPYLGASYSPAPTTLPQPVQAYWNASETLALNEDGYAESQAQEVHQDLVVAGQDAQLVQGTQASLLGANIANGETALVGYDGKAYYVTNDNGQVYAALVPDAVSPTLNK
ncbi:hypothetical protein Alches_20760 [Alicyclobacillus hesperidum subsp. aegles]|uniref:hypothetical protein n=1 Tax=Alicyclobacillus hesperidum TaxID=89784 RepID=UPI0007194114|nr:hypothetical protein [Alicyclobacillus hesperidum]KRW92304.1 hypothetical protein SD51_04555 [Alicyclobacillus tengchongensis]GLG02035.1 hypothetical protein Alches_20760 [Alicyclobacillus hesperidum subsp. aegles]